MPPGFRGEAPVAGTEFVAARTPDPAGGEPWGMMASRGARGGACLSQPGALVGTRVGSVVRRLGIFIARGIETLIGVPALEASSRRARTRCRSRRRSGGSSSRIRADASNGGCSGTRIVFCGRVHADVVSVTIRTPRDVRTLVPSSDVHAILAVYDGHFPGGKVTATARMKDGREVTRALHVE